MSLGYTLEIPLPPAGHKQSKHSRKEGLLHGKIISSHLMGAKLLIIITVNFGNKTKVFSENFGWLYVNEHLKHKHIAHT